MGWLKRISELRIGVASALLTTIVYLILIETAPLRILEGQALDLRFRLRGALAPGGDIAIVQINDQSIAQEGRWPWNRLKFAEAVRWLDEAGARVVVFDLLFGEPQESVAVASLKKMRKAMARLGEAEPENRDTALAALRRQVEEIGDDFDPDGALADAIEAAGNVILPFSFIFRADDDPLRSRARAASRAVGSWAYQGTRLAESEEPPPCRYARMTCSLR